jgi:hypothetical protein
MDNSRNAELTETIVHELEDLKNCQKAIMQKLAKIEVASLRLDDKRLEVLLPELQQRITDNLFAITDALQEFLNEKKEQANKDNVVDLMQASLHFPNNLLKVLLYCYKQKATLWIR